MAFRTKKRTGAILTAVMFLAPAALAEETLRYQVWHGHSRPPHVRKAGGTGTLTIGGEGIAFEESGGAHSWQWKYDDIQQLTVSPKSLKVLTYEDNKWKLGADRAYEFDLRSEGTFEGAYAYLRGRLDQRLVAAMASAPAGMLWEIPAKHLTRFGGEEGVLRVSENEIVYQSATANASRTWRYEDIDNVSSAGPFQLSITTFERDRSQYGSRKGFNFQLKQRLPEDRYNDLWRRLKGQ